MVYIILLFIWDLKHWYLFVGNVKNVGLSTCLLSLKTIVCILWLPPTEGLVCTMVLIYIIIEFKMILWPRNIIREGGMLC